MHIRLGQQIIDTIRGKKKQKIIIPLNPNYDKKPYKQIVSVTGFHYSGSSAVLGLLAEFDNTTVHGYAEPIYSKSKNKNFGAEYLFFNCSGIFDYIDSFKSKTQNQLEKDCAIRHLIQKIYSCYDKKGFWGGDYAPKLYNVNFLKISEEYLKSTIELTEEDLSFLESHRLPAQFNSSDTKYEKCSFMYGTGIGQYLFYKFKNLSEKEFDEITSKYFRRLFSTCICNDILVFDQMLTPASLKEINYFMQDNPIKQICVYRDPRDHFLSAYRLDVHPYLPRDIDAFCKWYASRYEEAVSENNPCLLYTSEAETVLLHSQ